jgi:hypothetical protein
MILKYFKMKEIQSFDNKSDNINDENLLNTQSTYKEEKKENSLIFSEERWK